MRTRRYAVGAFILGLLLAGNAIADEDSMRFRRGISGGGGVETGSGFSFTMAGIDGRLGAQISERFGVYAAPHLSFGSGNGGSTGTFALTFLGDFTFIERLFVAGGGGYGVLNNPSGPVLHFRVGGYPLLDEEDGLRKG